MTVIFSGMCDLKMITPTAHGHFSFTFRENFSVLYGVEEKKVMTKEIIFYVKPFPTQTKGAFTNRKAHSQNLQAFSE